MRILSLIWPFFCLLISHAVAEEPSEEQLHELHNQYMDQFWAYLENSEYTELRTTSAIRLLRTNNPLAVERGTHLITKVLTDPDPVSLWIMASDCYINKSAPWCGPDGAYKLLMQTDPDNAAVLVLGFNLKAQANDDGLLDTEFNRQLLNEAANARRFDTYWGRGADRFYKEALRFMEANPVPPVPSGFLPDLQPHAYAFSMIMSFVATVPTLGFSSISRFCRLQAENQNHEGIEPCKKLTRLMAENGGTFLTRIIGVDIEIAMLQAMNPDDSRILDLELRKKAMGVAQLCLSSFWLNDINRWSEIGESTMMKYAKNLSKLGEWESVHLGAIQEYESTPEYFVVNPASCDNLLDLDDKEMQESMIGLSASEKWQQLKTDAMAKSQE